MAEWFNSISFEIFQLFHRTHGYNAYIQKTMKTFEFHVRFKADEPAITIYINARDIYEAKKVVEHQYKGVHSIFQTNHSPIN